MNECGRSMIEMLGVLAIIGVLSAGGLAGYSKAMFKHKINKTVDSVFQTVIDIQTKFSGEPDGAKYAYLDSVMNQIDHPYLNKLNPFRGKFELGDAGNDIYFTIHLTLPSEACVALASYNWGSKDSNLIGIVVNRELDGDTGSLYTACSGIDISDGGEGYLACSDAIPMPMEYVTEACACEGLNCEIMLKYQ